MIGDVLQLPGAIQRAVPAERFLYAVRASSGYVVHEVTPAGRVHEREFDESLDRFLTIDERRGRLPPDEQFIVADRTVKQTHQIDADTEELRARFEILDDAGRAVAELTKPVFAPSPWRREDVVAEAIRRQDFPQEYASWPRDEKVRYWAAKLHRFRRVHGEGGQDEDELYTPNLVLDMEKLDPRVRDLLADIIAMVGQYEQTDAAEAIAAFERRSGITIRT